MKEHMLTHTGEKKKNLVKKPSSNPYRCPQCGARFAGLSALKNHTGKHTGNFGVTNVYYWKIHK